MEVIQSLENSTIKEVKKLKEKKYRVKQNQFLIEGFRFVTEALNSDFIVKSIFIDEKQKKRWDSFNIEKILNKHVKVYWTNTSIIKSICDTENPQGIAAVVEGKASELICKEGFYVLVDKVQDPGNLGTIIRTAHASGALGVILTKGTVDVYNEKTLRSTMGSVFKIPIIEDKDFDVINNLKSKGFKLVVSSLETNNNFYDIDLTDKVIISVGNEGNGVSKEIYNMNDELVKIPMPGNAESLNVAVAASIMMFEAVRQGNLKNKLKNK